MGVSAPILRVAVLALAFCATAGPAFGYGFFEFGNGRTDYANRYDLTGSMWPTQLGSPAIYDLGDVGTFATLPTGVTNAMLTTAAKNAGDAWERYANVKIGNALGAAAAGLIRLTRDAGAASVGTFGYGQGGRTYAEIVFPDTAPGGVAWSATNLQWTLMHEFGHVLGLDDLYLASAPYSEEFVDHPVAGTPMPDRRDRKDNVMDRYNGSGAEGTNDYSKDPTTVIDNDEIAGVTWLWSAPRNQIVTGDLAAAWNPSRGRNTEEHHGDQDNPLGWWDYRASIVSAGAGKSYIDLYFPGYETFLATSYGPVATGWVHAGTPRGPSIHRFETTVAAWVGNVELFVKSRFHEEQLIDAWVAGGREDQFIMNPSDAGLVWDGANRWAKVFGPIPFPPTLVLLLSGLAGAALAARVHRRS
ncbi:MAG: hypothetical protein A2X52_03925 [Candidatus Rokubacteria bacterium GWC2_70_16]|nr:MAG: hypothetical protein A2X52_03925 [Candidatus Rokubacteria bacterium GWC2_70_16]